MSERKGPVLIDLEEAETHEGPASAPPVPDTELPAPTGQAMQTVARLAARRGSRITRLFWSAALALVGFVASLAAWNFVTALLAANPVLGWIATGLIGVVTLTLLIIALREAAAFFRLGRLDALRQRAETAAAGQDLSGAKSVSRDLARLYQTRPELALGRKALARQNAELFDADAVLDLTEREFLQPLDDMARLEIEAAARQVATVTALVPLAMMDILTALTANLRMIRRIAEIYGGRAGTLGAWRLTRAVLTHLVATGAVAVGDDLLDSFIGGGILSKVSRRFGEGVVNGALTARVGVAAMEVCRPLPFREATRPSTSAMLRRALTGLFSSGKEV